MVINPATPVAMLDEVLDVVATVLVMSVNPGFGGQHFIPNSLKKVRELARVRKTERWIALSHRNRWRRDPWKTLQTVAQAGVEWIVAGTSVFHTVETLGAAYREELLRAARGAIEVKV